MRLLDQLSAAIELEVIAEVAGRPGRYRFAHALIRETISEELSPVRRTTLHRRFGDLLEARRHERAGDDLADLAHHFFEASAGGGEEKAMEYAERAGAQTMHLFAYEEAAEHFGRALRLAEPSPAADPARQNAILLALGEAQNRAGCGETAADTMPNGATAPGTPVARAAPAESGAAAAAASRPRLSPAARWA